jgi:hypothetical protein
MDGDIITVGVAANTTICKGTLTGFNASGYLESKDASGNVFAGVSAEGAVGTATAGETTCKVWRRGIFEMVFASAAITYNGDEMYVVDNQTIAASGTHKVGRAAKYESSGKQFIDIGGYC